MKIETMLLKEALETLKWNLDNCHVEERLQSDLFNINANVITNIEQYLNSHSFCTCNELWGVAGVCIACEKQMPSVGG